MARKPRAARGARPRAPASTSALEDALILASRALEEEGRPYALIGGLAIAVRAAPRFTYDVDFVVACSDSDAERLVGSFVRRGFRVDALLMTKTTQRIASVRLLPSDSAVLVDLLFDFTGIEERIVSEATPAPVHGGLTLNVASRGHLIAMKVLAFRDKDQIDLEQLLALATPGDLKTARSALEGIRSSGRAMGRDLIATLDALVRARARRAGEFVKVPRSRWPEGWGPQRKKRRGK